MSTEKLIPDSPDRWNITAGTKQKLRIHMLELQKALGLRKMSQTIFMQVIADNWPVIQKAITDNKKV